MVSRELVSRIRLSQIRGYQIAQLAGIHPSTLSKIVNGIGPIKLNDPRVISVGRVFGLRSDECFEPAANERDGSHG